MKADFPELWAESPSTLRREPTPTEFAGGFPCGPLDLPLFNELMFRLGQVYREAAYAITQSGQTPNANNTGQLWEAIKAAAPTVSQASLWHYGVASGTANAIVVASPSPPITTYSKGVTCLVELPTTFGVVTGATLRIGSLPVVNLLRNDGNLIQTGDGPPGAPMLVEYDGGNFRLVGFGRAEIQRIVVNPVLWVRTDGNDSNDGSANDAAHAFATIGAAQDRGTNQFNFASSSLTIRLGIPGTYASPQYIPRGSGTINIVGDAGNQAGYVLSGVGSPGQGVVQTSGVTNFTGLTIQNNSTQAHTIAATSGSVIVLFNVTLATTQTTSGVHAYGAGGTITLATGCIMQGNASSALWGDTGGSVTINTNTNLVIQGNPTFATAFAYVTNGGRVTLAGGASVSGAASGQRFLGFTYGIISTNGAGPNAFPGTTAGSTTNALYS